MEEAANLFIDHLGQGVGWSQTGTWTVANPPNPVLTITTTSLPAGMVNAAGRLGQQVARTLRPLESAGGL